MPDQGTISLGQLKQEDVGKAVLILYCDNLLESTKGFVDLMVNEQWVKQHWSVS